MKICKNCFWFLNEKNKFAAQCMYEKEYSVDIIFGHVKWKNHGPYISCREARKKKNICGIEARLFKPKV